MAPKSCLWNWMGDANFCHSVVRSESVRNIIRERRMLEHVNHPFICNLRYSFQDIEYMYATISSAVRTRLTGAGTW